MGLTKGDKNWIKNTITEEITKALTDNTKSLMVWISENFLTKEEGVTKDYIDKQLRPIKEDVSTLKDHVAGIKYRLDEAELPFIVKTIDRNKAEVDRIKRFVNYKENNKF